MRVLRWPGALVVLGLPCLAMLRSAEQLALGTRARAATAAAAT